MFLKQARMAVLNRNLTNSFFRRFSGHSIKQALFVYRLMGATLIGILFQDPFQIEIFVKRCNLATLGERCEHNF